MKISNNAEYVSDLSNDNYQVWEVIDEYGGIKERTEYFPSNNYMRICHYDAKGRLTEVTDSSGNYTHIIYKDNIIAIQRKTSFLYTEKVYSDGVLVKEYLKTTTGSKEYINPSYSGKEDTTMADHKKSHDISSPSCPTDTNSTLNNPVLSAEDIAKVSIMKENIIHTPQVVNLPDITDNEDGHKDNNTSEKQKLSVQSVKNFVNNKLKRQQSEVNHLIFHFENEGIKKDIHYTKSGTIFRIETLYKSSSIVSIQDLSENVNYNILPDGTTNVIDTDVSGNIGSVRTIKPDGTFITENAEGKTIDYFDKEGNFTEFSYDNLGNVITKHLVDKEGNETWLNIDNSSSYLSMMDNGKYSIESFDCNGKLIYYRDPDNIEYRYEYLDTEMSIKGHVSTGDEILIKYNSDNQLVFFDNSNCTYEVARQYKQMIETFLDKKTMAESRLNTNYTPIALCRNLYDIPDLLKRRFINVDNLFK